MASIVYQENKKTGVVYAYRSESYRDPVTKQPRSHRTYLGRVDPVTKEIIEKAEPGKRNRSRLTGENGTGSVEEKVNTREQELSDQVDKLKKQLNDLKANFKQMRALISDMDNLMEEIESKM